MDATRRSFLISASRLAGVLGLVSILPVPRAAAMSPALQEAITKVVGQAQVEEGKVTLDLPPLVENGNAVSLGVRVDSPMSAEDHVKAIHLFTEKNPRPNVASFWLGPRAGRANVSTRIRLADSQDVIAIAEMSDGSFWSARTHVVITLAACLEEG